MLGRFENFKINENLYGKPLNRDWVARGVRFSYTFGDVAIAVLVGK